MKTRILLTLMLLVSALVFGQTNMPPCNAVAGVTTNCTDYFGVANYANSPLPVGSVDISATGFTIVDGGSGYDPPLLSPLQTSTTRLEPLTRLRP